MDNIDQIVDNRKFYQKKRVMIPFTMALAFIFISLFGAIHSSLYQTTSKAYIDDYLINIYPKISEKIIELNVENNSQVKKGEIILELDGNKYFKEVQKLEEEFNNIKSNLNSFENEIEQINIKNNLIKKELANSKNDLERANDDYIRYKIAFKDGTVTKKDLDKAIQNLDIAQEEYEEAKNQLKSTRNLLEEILSKKNSQMDDLKNITENLEEAKIELSNSTIVAPKNGKIINLNSKIGDSVDEDEVLFSIIPDECYIIANFKKNKNKTIELHQKATIKIYSHGFKKLNGEIVEIKPLDAKTIQTKIKITDDISKYRFKNNTRVHVRTKTN